MVWIALVLAAVGASAPTPQPTQRCDSISFTETVIAGGLTAGYGVVAFDGDGDGTSDVGTAAQTAPRKQQQQPPLVERLYGYSQHGDRMYGGTDKMLRFFQYSLACLGCKL